MYRYVTRLFLRAGSLARTHRGLGAAVASLLSPTSLPLIPEYSDQQNGGVLGTVGLDKSPYAGGATVRAFVSLLQYRQLRGDSVFALGLIA